MPPTLLYINSEDVIPAPAFAGVNLSPRTWGAGIQLSHTGFRVKLGMTIKVEGLLTKYISAFIPLFYLLEDGLIEIILPMVKY
jgi:hypothetical protein